MFCLLLETFFNLTSFLSPNQTIDWRNEVFTIGEGKVGRALLFKKIVHLTGLQFTKNAFSKFNLESKWNYKEPLDLLDLTEMGDRVKDMAIVSSSQVRRIFFSKSRFFINFFLGELFLF